MALVYSGNAVCFYGDGSPDQIVVENCSQGLGTGGEGVEAKQEPSSPRKRQGLSPGQTPLSGQAGHP